MIKKKKLYVKESYQKKYINYKEEDSNMVRILHFVKKLVSFNVHPHTHLSFT